MNERYTPPASNDSESPEKHLSRRQFIKKAAAVVAAGTLGAATIATLLKEQLPETEADRILAEFPEQISGAKSIEKYPAIGAKHCLVYIRQTHQTSEMSKEDEISVIRCQTDIYSILSDLIEKYKLKTVYQEGYTRELAEAGKNLSELKTELGSALEDAVAFQIEYVAQDIENIKQGLKSELSIAFEAREKNISPEEVIGKKKATLADLEQRLAELTKKVQDMKNKDGQKTDNLLSAGKRLDDEGKLEIKGMETMAGNIKGKAALVKYRKDNTDENLKNAMTYAVDERENIALEIMAEDSSPLIVFVYGAAHDFVDNVRNWNKTNKDNTCGLIVLTPQNL